MAPEQQAVELRYPSRLDAYALARCDSGREAVDDVAALEHALDDRARLAHSLDRVRRELDPFARARDGDDVVQPEIVAREDDRHARTLKRVLQPRGKGV